MNPSFRQTPSSRRVFYSGTERNQPVLGTAGQTRKHKYAMTEMLQDSQFNKIIDADRGFPDLVDTFARWKEAKEERTR